MFLLNLVSWFYFKVNCWHHNLFFNTAIFVDTLINIEYLSDFWCNLSYCVLLFCTSYILGWWRLFTKSSLWFWKFFFSIQNYIIVVSILKINVILNKYVLLKMSLVSLTPKNNEWSHDLNICHHRDTQKITSILFFQEPIK